MSRAPFAGTAILWDIDGTLLRAAGTGIRSFSTALMNVTGLPFPSAPIDMGGRTDPNIAELILAAAGHADPTALPVLLAEVEAVWALLEDEFRELTTAKPGVEKALAELANRGSVQTVVTGNLESVARRKIAAAGLGEHIRLDLGGYGSDHAIRVELVRLARARLGAAGFDAAPDNTWVIGDTHRDLACAREAGVRCVLVATGSQPLAELMTLDADACLPDLSDIAQLLGIVGSGG